MNAYLLPLMLLAAQGPDIDVVNIGSRRELFVDRAMIAELRGSARLVLHRPKPQEVVFRTDRPWEGNTSAYFTIFQDGGIYRMYYRGSHWDVKRKRPGHREVACYAESKDGIHWYRPNLGLFEFNGSKQNNIVRDGLGTHNFTPFKDANPNCPDEARYKALASGRDKRGRGLFAFQSPDGIHWKLMSKTAVIRKGRFDSQNLAFWDSHAGLYREYHRDFVNGVRAIRTSTSRDFLHWTPPVFLRYPTTPKKFLSDHLYTNAVMPYPRAPHILIGFPTRYYPNRGSQVEPTFMVSRDGINFHRWTDPLIPVTAPKDRDGNRSNYMAWGLVQLPGKPAEYSVYATEAYYTGPDSRLRRFTFRVDGFVSVHGDDEPGVLITRPFRFQADQLEVNFATAKNGTVKVEILTADRKPVPGFAGGDAAELTGDAIDRVVSWPKGKSVAALAGRPLRRRITLRRADIYSFRFTGKARR